MASVTEPPTLRSIPPSAGGTTSLRRSYSCYNCNYSFHIVPTADTSSTSPSSFRCPRCHHRHLLPHYTISPDPALPVSSFLSTPTNYPPDISSFEYQTSDESEESDYDYDYDEDYDSDNSVLSLTVPISHSAPPALQSFVDSLPVKKFPPNSTPPAQSCSICMEVFDVNSDASGTINELPCQHLFHRDCIVEWLKRSSTCPLCRHKLPSDSSPEEGIDRGQTNELGVEYNAVLVVDSTPVREPTLSRASGGGSLHSNGGVSGSERRGSTANGGQLSALELDAMRDEDGDTLMTDA